MRKKLVIFLILAIFIFAQAGDIYARSRSGGSKSSSSRSSKSFGGYSGSSKSSSSSKSSGSSKSSSGYSGSSKSSKGFFGYSGSSKSGKSSGTSSRNIPGTAKSAKANSAKQSYMQDYYKSQVSKSNYKTYKQNLNSEQQKVYQSSMNTSYKIGNKLNLEQALKTRPQRITVYNTRPIVIKVKKSHFGGSLSYGSAYVGPWDMWFLMRASDLFWFHHWHEIYPYRSYFDDDMFEDMEDRVRALEYQNMVRDVNYLEPGVDHDLQFTPDYQQRYLNNLYYTNKHPSRIGSVIVTIIVLIGIVVVLIIIIRLVSRPKPKPPTYSRIY